MTPTRLAVKPSCHPPACARQAKAILWLVVAFTSLARALACLVGASASHAVVGGELLVAIASLLDARTTLAIATAKLAREAAPLARAFVALVIACTRHAVALASAARASAWLPDGFAGDSRAVMATAIPDTKRLPPLIARARREAKVAQQALADALEISLRTLSRWETGKHYPGPEQARDLAYALSRRAARRGVRSSTRSRHPCAPRWTCRTSSTT